MDVKDVYNAIARHFDATRYKPWPVVAHFLDTQPAQSIGLDVGCGNGKNFPSLSSSCSGPLIVGLDISEELCRIARHKSDPLLAVFHPQVLVGDARQLPLRTGLFDFALSIAVIHHLPRREERIQALQQIYDALVPGGRLLVFVWAMEQTRVHQLAGLRHLQDTDYLVPWRDASGQVFPRFYHLYGRGEVERELLGTGRHFVIETSGYDRDNWYVIAKKAQLPFIDEDYCPTDGPESAGGAA
jgi:tRNA (uracil-5-)-methyltransferase TRM9